MTSIETIVSSLMAEIDRIVDRKVEEKLPALNIDSEEAEKMRQTVARIMAKNLITINELRILLGECSHGYVDKLIEAAHKGTTEHPLPYCDLDGLIVFEPEKVMAWARESKPLKPKRKKSGGRRNQQYPQAVNA